MRERSDVKKKIKKGIRGITLIALVVTIVVLLILAGVSINLVIGNNGIITRAGDAKRETELAMQNEQTAMSDLYDEMLGFLGESAGGSGGKVQIELSIAGTKVTTVPIPDGFAYKEGSIDTGYVIINETDGNEFVWVPVEKDQKITLKITSEEDVTEVKLYDPLADAILTLADEDITTTYNNTNIEPTINGMYIAQVTTEDGMEEKTLIVKSLYAGDCPNYFYTSEEFAKIRSEEMFGETLNKEQFWEALATQKIGAESLEAAIQSVGCTSLDQFITFMLGQELKNDEDLEDYTTSSVNSNGGFYIGRYEAGATTERTSSNSSATVDDIITANGTPVSKEGYAPYNYVTFDQALGLAESMYTSSDFEASLLTFLAWLRTFNWIYETGGKNYTEIEVDSGSWGNYIDVEFEISKGKYSENNGRSYTEVSGTYKKEKDDAVLLTTGATTRNAVNNIYDLAGNVSEWTNEDSGNPIRRGGSCGGSGSNCPAIERIQQRSRRRLQLRRFPRSFIFVNLFPNSETLEKRKVFE